jgi:hypothetical protein
MWKTIETLANIELFGQNTAWYSTITVSTSTTATVDQVVMGSTPIAHPRHFYRHVSP